MKPKLHQIKKYKKKKPKIQLKRTHKKITLINNKMNKNNNRSKKQPIHTHNHSQNKTKLLDNSYDYKK